MSLGGALIETVDPPAVETFVVEMQVYGLRQRLPMQWIAAEDTAGGSAVRARFVGISPGQEVMLLTILHDLGDEQQSAIRQLKKSRRVA